MNKIEKYVFRENKPGEYTLKKEHRELIAIYNEIVEYHEQDKPRVKFAEILSKLTDYGIAHFRKEDVAMATLKYPLREIHKRFHSEYTFKVARFNMQLLGSHPPMPSEILSFIQEWWIDHIEKHDAAFERFKLEEQVEAG